MTTDYVPPTETEKLLARTLHSNTDGIVPGPTQVTYHKPHQILNIAIGRDHTATIVIGYDALEELQKRLPGHFPSMHK